MEVSDAHYQQNQYCVISYQKTDECAPLVVTDSLAIDKTGEWQLHANGHLVNTSVVPSKKHLDYGDFFDQCVAECTTVCTAGIEAVTEMSQYLKTKNLERKDDHIKCWKDQEAVYPNLQRSAKNF